MAVRQPTEDEVRSLLQDFPWPSELLVGCAAAAYQVEGGYNVGDGPRNNWAEWEVRPGNERTGAAARFWDQPDRDYRLAQSMGLNAHRLSIEWARVQPVYERRLLDEPPPFDERVIGRYAELLVKARAHGLEPVVTLHHFTHPYWLGQDPWLTDRGVPLFIAYVEHVVVGLNARLVERGQAPVRTWVTVNEPNALGPASYMSRWMPSGTQPDLRGPGRMLQALDRLYEAHVRAYGAIHRAYEQHGWAAPRVGFNNFVLDVYGPDRFFVDLMLSRSRGVTQPAALRRDLTDRARAYHEALAGVIGHSRKSAPERWLAAHGFRQLASQMFHPGRFPRLQKALAESDRARPLDYVGVDYYDPMTANQMRHTAGGYEPWEWEVYPEGLYDIVRANATDGLPVLVAENGMATRRTAGGKAEPRPDGLSRDEFLRASLFHVLRAMKDGAACLGYLHWSLTDNYEWGRYSPRFGIYGVDYADPQRRRLPVDASGVDAAGTFGALAKGLLAHDAEALGAALVG